MACLFLSCVTALVFLPRQPNGCVAMIERRCLGRWHRRWSTVHSAGHTLTTWLIWPIHLSGPHLLKNSSGASYLSRRRSQERDVSDSWGPSVQTWRIQRTQLRRISLLFGDDVLLILTIFQFWAPGQLLIKLLFTRRQMCSHRLLQNTRRACAAHSPDNSQLLSVPTRRRSYKEHRSRTCSLLARKLEVPLPRINR